MLDMSRRSMTSPPSVVLCPTTLCPPLRIAELVALVARRGDHSSHVVDVGDAHDRRGPLVDAAVEDGARLVVVGIVRRDHTAGDAGEAAA